MLHLILFRTFKLFFMKLKIEILDRNEIDKLCNLLECNEQDLLELQKKALTISNQSQSVYDSILKILQEGVNVREATITAYLLAHKIGYTQAENDMEEEIKNKLYNAFKRNSQ